MAGRASLLWRKHRPTRAHYGVIQGGWGGCSGSGTAPDSGEPMRQVSPSMTAGDGPNGGDFVFGHFY